jgi:predicted Zn finger-like uncharacterized protein
MFKVVPDQLRISEGWVRCGQCGEIFNASQQLLSNDGPRPTSAPAVPAATPTEATGPQIADTAPPVGPPTAMPVDFGHGMPPAAEPVAPALRAAGAPAVVDQQAHRAGPDAAGPSGDAPAMPFSLPRGYLDNPPAPPTPVPWPDQAGVAPEAGVSFMRDDATDSFWRHRAVRLALLVVAIALAAVLAAQVLMHERNRIAQTEPAARPVLAGLCALAHCELGPLRQIESIVIDSSSFGRLRADNYRLGFSLRNTAPVDVSMPAIELSLTDSQDQALIRRVIQPAEFGAPTASLSAGSDWSATLALNVRPAANTDRITGYRLLAFYP